MGRLGVRSPLAVAGSSLLSPEDLLLGHSLPWENGTQNPVPAQEEERRKRTDRLSQAEGLCRTACIRPATQKERELKVVALRKATHLRSVALEIPRGLEGEPEDPETALAKGGLHLREQGSCCTAIRRPTGQGHQERDLTR